MTEVAPVTGAGVALVTGAGGGIGAAVAARLDADGWTVVCADLDAERAAAAASGLRGAGHLVVDVSDAASVDRLRAQVTAGPGAPGLLVNAAGVFSTHRVPELAEAEWDRLVDVNLKGPFLTCRAFLPAMIEAGRGCIVNVASTAGLRGGRERAAYSASKGGLVLFSRSLALDHGPDGVRVSCVCPGLIDTPMADWIRHDAAAVDRFARGVPAGRLGTPAEVADAVAWLASPQASYSHGTVLTLDGGGLA